MIIVGEWFQWHFDGNDDESLDNDDVDDSDDSDDDDDDDDEYNNDDDALTLTLDLGMVYKLCGKPWHLVFSRQKKAWSSYKTTTTYSTELNIQTKLVHNVLFCNVLRYLRTLHIVWSLVRRREARPLTTL